MTQAHNVETVADEDRRYALVDPSPWPIVMSAVAFAMAVGAVVWLAAHKGEPIFPNSRAIGGWVFFAGLAGVIATMYDGHTRHARDMLTRIREHYGLAIFDPPVRKSIRFAEAPQIGRCILQHDPSSPGAEAYRSIARDLDAVATSIEPEPPFALAPVFSYEDLLATRYAFVS